MRYMILLMTALTFSGAAIADCEIYPLTGEWSVFYHETQEGDIETNSKIKITKTWFGNYRVDLEDPVWKVNDKKWKYSCLQGKRAELKGFFNEKTSLSPRNIPVKITRVINIKDLQKRADGSVKLNQVEVDIPVRPKPGEHAGQNPGHAHGDQ